MHPRGAGHSGEDGPSQDDGSSQDNGTVLQEVIDVDVEDGPADVDIEDHVESLLGDEMDLHEEEEEEEDTVDPEFPNVLPNWGRCPICGDQLLSNNPGPCMWNTIKSQHCRCHRSMNAVTRGGSILASCLMEAPCRCPSRCRN